MLIHRFFGLLDRETCVSYPGPILTTEFHIQKGSVLHHSQL